MVAVIFSAIGGVVIVLVISGDGVMTAILELVSCMDVGGVGAAGFNEQPAKRIANPKMNKDFFIVFIIYKKLFLGTWIATARLRDSQ